MGVRVFSPRRRVLGDHARPGFAACRSAGRRGRGPLKRSRGFRSPVCRRRSLPRFVFGVSSTAGAVAIRHLVHDRRALAEPGVDKPVEIVDSWRIAVGTPATQLALRATITPPMSLPLGRTSPRLR